MLFRDIISKTKMLKNKGGGTNGKQELRDIEWKHTCGGMAR